MKHERSFFQFILDNFKYETTQLLLEIVAGIIIAIYNLLVKGIKWPVKYLPKGIQFLFLSTLFVSNKTYKITKIIFFLAFELMTDKNLVILTNSMRKLKIGREILATIVNTFQIFSFIWHTWHGVW
jgi:hypothetical protein